jgi:hypothetical protein
MVHSQANSDASVPPRLPGPEISYTRAEGAPQKWFAAYERHWLIA